VVVNNQLLGGYSQRRRDEPFSTVQRDLYAVTQARDAIGPRRTGVAWQILWRDEQADDHETMPVHVGSLLRD
jgi:hypothetical protein